MTGKLLIPIVLLAGLVLASSCNSTKQVIQPIDDDSRVTPIDAIENRTVIDESKPPISDEEMFAPHTLIISYDTEVGTAALDSAIIFYGAEVIYRYRIINAVAIRIPDDKDIHVAIKFFELVKGVVAVNRDRKMQLM